MNGEGVHAPVETGVSPVNLSCQEMQVREYKQKTLMLRFEGGRYPHLPGVNNRLLCRHLHPLHRAASVCVYTVLIIDREAILCRLNSARFSADGRKPVHAFAVLGGDENAI